MVDELFFESFSFNAPVGSLRVWVTKSSYNISSRYLYIILFITKIYGCQRLSQGPNRRAE
jgi:hypothetical protein